MNATNGARAAGTAGGSASSEITHLRAAGVSLVLDLGGGALPRILHWGGDLGEPTPAELKDLRLAARPQPVGFSVDDPVDVAVLPEQSAGWLGTPGLIGNRGGRSFSTTSGSPSQRQRRTACACTPKTSPHVSNSTSTST